MNQLAGKLLRVAACCLLGVAPLALAGQQPRIGLIIDDIGFQAVMDEAVLALDERVAVAIIPNAPGARHLARQAGEQGREILIHLPLSRAGPLDCDAPVCPRREWSPERMRQHLAWASERVNGAIGLNNHQGSGFTADPLATSRLIEGLVLLNGERDQPLFVIDSRTTPGTRLASSAREAGLGVAERQVFLDHDRDPDAIASAWARLLATARRDGQAIAIAHPHTETLEFLPDALAGLAAYGVELVPISTLIETASATSRAVLDYRSATEPSAP